ncbi:hypothetical protein ACNQF7_11200 [Flavobacterium sp. RSP29]|uniref:hypothetical protein n=1 Tax=Flavobacterium sp. RSP29 TaxID=3401731 RepID=UPI003AB02859
MNTVNFNNDYRDWILSYGVDDDNYVLDISKHSDFINNLDEIGEARFKLAIKEMLMNNTLSEHKKDKIYLLTSLGREVLENGGFSGYNPHISSELNINEQFSKNLDISKRATKITICVAFGTLIVLMVQTYLSTLPSTIRIEKEQKSKTKSKPKPKPKTQELESNLHSHYQTSKDSLKKEFHIQAKK